MRKRKETFRAWRTRNGLSVMDIALRTRIDYNTLAGLDRNPTRRPRKFHAARLREKFPGCPVGV
jgi:hypothetical protein